MSKITYGRRFLSLEAKETQTTTYSISRESNLIFRTYQDRPLNEDRIRGMC